MLMFITITIGIISVCGLIIACYVNHVVGDLKRKVDYLNASAITYFSKPTCQYDMAVHELNILIKALHEQGIATNYVSENKLDYRGCKESKEI